MAVRKFCELTSRERMGLFLIDERPDRIPLLPLITNYAMRFAAGTIKDYCTDGKIMAQAHIKTWKRFRHDAIMLFSDVGIVAEAFGTKYEYPDNAVPEILEPVLGYLENVDDLNYGNSDAPGRWGVYYDAIEKTYSEVGDLVPIMAFIPAPFTTAAGIRGIEDLLTDLILEPERVLKCLDAAANGVRALINGVMERGALPVLVDPLASGSVLSNEQFHAFALPYIKSEIDYMHKYDMDVMLHICGNTHNIMTGITDTGTDLFSFDDLPAHTACTTLGDKIRLVGNLRPSQILNWKPEQVIQASTELIQTAKYVKKGFALSTGCEVPLDTPVENIDALMATGRSLGRIWD